MSPRCSKAFGRRRDRAAAAAADPHRRHDAQGAHVLRPRGGPARRRDGGRAARTRLRRVRRRWRRGHAIGRGVFRQIRRRSVGLAAKPPRVLPSLHRLERAARASCRRGRRGAREPADGAALDRAQARHARLTITPIGWANIERTFGCSLHDHTVHKCRSCASPDDTTPFLTGSCGVGEGTAGFSATPERARGNLFRCRVDRHRDRVFVRRRLFQRIELAAQQCRRHEVAGAKLQPRGDQVEIALQVHQPHIGALIVGDHIAIGALERRAGHDAGRPARRCSSISAIALSQGQRSSSVSGSPRLIFAILALGWKLSASRKQTTELRGDGLADVDLRDPKPPSPRRR